MKSICGKILLSFLAPLFGKRLWMSIIAIIVLTGHTMIGINYLYSFTLEWQANIFLKIWQWSEGGILIVVLSYLGLQTWKNGDKLTDLLEKIIK